MGEYAWVKKNFEDAVNHKEPAQIPMIIWGGAPFVSRYSGVTEKDYYHDSQTKIDCTLKVQNDFPEAMMFPGLYAYFGTTIEASVLGADIVWPEDGPSHVNPMLTDIKQVLKMKPGNVKKDGLMPKVLAEYEYFWKHFPKSYIEDYGYLDGIAHCMGPLQVASMIRGQTELFYDLYDEPELVHKLLEITTETVIDILHAVETVNGPLKRLAMADHIPGQINRAQFEEFGFPYLKRVFDEFPNAIKLYHNEDHTAHFIDRIPDFGANIFHFGEVDRKLLKQTIGDKVTLMGNVHPIRTLYQGTPDMVKEECELCIKELAQGGGFLLSSGGGMAPGTPKENIVTMMKSVSK